MELSVEQPPKEEQPKEEKKFSYSMSKLRTQATCPARLYFRKLAEEGKIQEDPALALVYGSAAHKGIEKKLTEGANSLNVANAYIDEHLRFKFPAKNLDPEKLQKRQDLMEKCLTNFNTEFYDPIMRTFEAEGADITQHTEVKISTPFRQGTLVGVVDLMMPGKSVYVDWKSGGKIPSDEGIVRDPQSGIYYYIARDNGMPRPKQFDYVYLAGKNVNYKRAAKSGKPTPDKDNPKIKYSFPVYQDDAKIDRLMAEYVHPLAEQLERGVLFKNPSDLNCNSCQYRTACRQTDLPSVEEARESFIASIMADVTTENEEE